MKVASVAVGTEDWGQTVPGKRRTATGNYEPGQFKSCLTPWLVPWARLPGIPLASGCHRHALEAVTEWSKREWRGTDSSSISCRNTNMLLGVEAAKPARGLLRDLFLVLFKIAIKWQKVVLKPPLNNFIIVCCLCHRRVKLINC